MKLVIYYLIAILGIFSLILTVAGLDSDEGDEAHGCPEFPGTCNVFCVKHRDMDRGQCIGGVCECRRFRKKSPRGKHVGGVCTY